MMYVTSPSARDYLFALLLLINIRLVFSKEINRSLSMTTFFSGYDKALRPDFGARPTEVFADLYIESFGNIEEANMEFKVYGYLRQQWKDERLAGKLNSTITIKGGDINRLWLPDPFCYNARETNLMLPDSEVPSKVSVDIEGLVFYTKSVVFLASCEMDLHHFPFDSQECFLKFGSYAYTTDDIVYKWKYKDVTLGSTQMAQFNFRTATLSSFVDKYIIGDFSVITITFSFKRRIGYYLIQVYFPDMFIVALSWIVFWMEKSDMGNRMALGITTILTIMFLLGSINGTMPKVSYPKALDWYLLVSFTFTFLSLVECMVVFIIWLSDDKRKVNKNGNLPSPTQPTMDGTHIHELYDYTSSAAQRRSRNLELCHLQVPPGQAVEHGSEAMGDDVTGNHAPTARHNKARSMEEIADCVDRASRALFPLVFVLYNLVYWCYYSL